MYRDTENKTEEIIPDTYMWHYSLKSGTLISNFTPYITKVITYCKKQAQKSSKRKKSRRAEILAVLDLQSLERK